MSSADTTNLVTFSDGDAAVVADRRYEAVIISTWFGAPSMELIEQYFDWLDAAIADLVERDTPHGLINDASDAGRPQPTVRRRMVERGDQTSSEAVRLLVGSYTVIANPLIRGVMTAIGWISRGHWKTTVVPSCGDAIRGLRRDFEARSLTLTPQLQPGSYERPSRPDAA